MELYFKENIANVEGSKTYKQNISNNLDLKHLIVKANTLIDLKYEKFLYKSGYICISFFMEDAESKVLYAITFWTKKDEKLSLQYAVVSQPDYTFVGELRYGIFTPQELEVYSTDKKLINYTTNRLNDETLVITYTLMCYAEKVTVDETSMNTLGVNLFTIYCRLDMRNINKKHSDFVDRLKLKEMKIPIAPITLNKYVLKIMPMTVGEAIRLGDLYFRTWREIVISMFCCDLFINGICYNFPTAANWTYINYVTPENLFDTTEILNVISDNGQVRSLVEKLSNFYKLENDYTSNVIGHDLTKKKIKSTLEAIIRDNLLSPIAIAMLTERTGELKSTYKVTEPTVIEAIYSLCCLHTVVGVLHFNINSRTITALDNNKSVCLCINGEKETYTIQVDKSIYFCNFEDAVISNKFMNISCEKIKCLERNISTNIEDVLAKLLKYSKQADKKHIQLIEKLSLRIDNDEIISMAYPIDFLDLFNTLNYTDEKLIEFYTNLLDENVKCFISGKPIEYKLPFSTLYSKYKSVPSSISTVCVYTNLLEYSCVSFDHYPPWLQYVENKDVPSGFDIDISLKLLIENLDIKYK